jgi:hypothetical protein
MKKLIFVAATAIFVLAGCSASVAAPVTGTGKNIPVITTFTADPANIAVGGATQVNWRVSNATSVVIDNAIGTVALSGAFTVYPTGNTSYKITATNSAGSSSAVVKITVGNQGGPGDAPASTGTDLPVAPTTSLSSTFYKPMVANFSARPSNIQNGDKSTLSWTVQNADTVTIDRGIGRVSVSGAMNVKPAETTIYTLTAYNKAGSATASTSVQVAALPAVPVIRWFTSNPSTILQDRPSTLGWDVTNSTYVRISGMGNVADSGSMLVYPGFTTIYTLVATNPGGSSQAACQVTVQEVP